MSDPSLAFPPRGEGDDVDFEPVGSTLGSEPTGGTGPRVVSLGELPAFRVRGVVLANELLDNLAFRLLERREEGWQEVRLGASPDESALVEALVPADEGDIDLAQRLAPGAPIGGRLPVQRAAGDWLARALGALERGRVVVLDYASDSPDLAARPWVEWVRTYRAHEPGGDPWSDLGTQDITCEVDEVQLGRVRRPDRSSLQAAFLTGHGIAELVEEGRQVWRERGHVGDLDALRARSRVAESEALVDPTGLGAFRVLEWIVADHHA